MSKYRIVERGDGSFTTQIYCWFAGWVKVGLRVSSLEDAKEVLARHKRIKSHHKDACTVVRIYKESEL